MSNENQILIRAAKFMNYWHPDIPRTLPPAAQAEYNLLRDVINLHLEAKVEKPPAKKAKKKVAKKK